jgi:hypothetical protein
MNFYFPNIIRASTRREKGAVEGEHERERERERYRDRDRRHVAERERSALVIFNIYYTAESRYGERYGGISRANIQFSVFSVRQGSLSQL